MDAVLSRHSTRDYTDRPVSKELLDALLKAAMAAPSAEDERPWHFVVITDQRTRNEIVATLLYAHVVMEAPAAILVCGDESMQRVPGFWPLDCAAATENILVEAEELGLGTSWIRLYPIPGRIQACRSLLKIPDHVTPFALVAVGYPADKKAPENRYDESRVHQETWPVVKPPDSGTNGAPGSQTNAHVCEDIRCPHCDRFGATYLHAGPAHWTTLKCAKCGRCFELDVR